MIDTLLSEEAVLGFEYGYTTADPKSLVLWEAQFGDFANGAQVVVDQFISSGEMKWLRMSGLVMLLPHGYEGQGPEHSSARLERYLQLCAQDNMQVCVPTTPANYFHVLLRRQMHRPFRKPPDRADASNRCCVTRNASPSSATWAPATASIACCATRPKWCPAPPPLTLVPDDKIERVVLCSGKVYFDLMEEREKRNENRIQILRLEQLYPFPENVLAQELEPLSPRPTWSGARKGPKTRAPGTSCGPRIAETVAKLGGKAVPPLCRAAESPCLHRGRPDETASRRAGRFPQRRIDPLKGRA